MNKFRTDTCCTKQKINLVDDPLSPSQKEQDISSLTEHGSSRDSKCVIRFVDASNRTHTHTRARCYLQPRGNPFWSSRMIDRFLRYTSPFVFHYPFECFAFLRPRHNSTSFLNAFIIIRSPLLSSYMLCLIIHACPYSIKLRVLSRDINYLQKIRGENLFRFQLNGM